jgi:hypothetical protein
MPRAVGAAESPITTIRTARRTLPMRNVLGWERDGRDSYAFVGIND